MSKPKVVDSLASKILDLCYAAVKTPGRKVRVISPDSDRF
jgi:hypothetical protein